MTLSLLRTLSVASLLSLCAACSILPKSEPVTIYRLPATTSGSRIEAASAPPAMHQRTLRILTPYGGNAIDSARILVIPSGDLLQSYAGVRWSDPAPVMLRNRLLQAFSDDGRIPNLSSDNSNVMADLQLGGDLFAFQSEYRNGVPTIVIQFNANLIDSASRRIIAVHNFSITQPVSGGKVPEVVNAFGQASDLLAADVINWVLGLPAISLKP